MSDTPTPRTDAVAIKGGSFYRKCLELERENQQLRNAHGNLIDQRAELEARLCKWQACAKELADELRALAGDWIDGRTKIALAHYEKLLKENQ